MARTDKISFKEFRNRYATNNACRDELFRLRFPNGFVCPKCGCVEFYPIRNRNAYQCVRVGIRPLLLLEPLCTVPICLCSLGFGQFICAPPIKEGFLLFN